MVGLAALLAILGLNTWDRAASILMVVPILYVVAASLYQGGPETRPLLLSAHLLAGVLLFSSLVAIARVLGLEAEHRPHLALGLFFTTGLVFYAVAARLHKQTLSVVMAAILACGVMWQLFSLANVPQEYHPLVFAGVGLVLVAGYRFELFGEATTEMAFTAGNVLLTLSFISGALLILSRVLGPREVIVDEDGVVTGTVWLPLFCLALLLTAAGVASVALVPERSWRRWYVVASIMHALLALMVLTFNIDLTPWEKARIFASLTGLVLLVASHIGWHREEQEQQSDLVSLGLLAGSLLLGVPQMIAGIHGRVEGTMVWYDEVAFFAVGVLLLTSGFMLQLKSTTIFGALMTAAYVVTLLAFVPWSQLNAVALTITIGGGVLFGLGLLLSVFRERLLALPEQIKNREGLFRVLGWR
jgi:hypothetical protein